MWRQWDMESEEEQQWDKSASEGIPVLASDSDDSIIFVAEKHYKNDVNRVSLNIGDSYKDVFKKICHEMCSVTTVAEYNDRKK